ncbi:GntR family transcriptional regulator [Nesterenkonia sp. PF2B19]|uniref:GntR family transcriptional regulator n=1 Tax=unclassified Nesterenkonia TaxID=2629769 RepID=UPI00087266A9|nr:GntR family transcriptional regulator [Nesterenkonia sp. PF2B19]OSM44033.1 GntR family transcriptional regulator [Nesterenkonia sp. PF2B19]
MRPDPSPAAGPLPLGERAYRELRDRLILLDIPAGAPISENALTEELGIGRTPLREALKRLETDHLVVTYPRRGTFATPADVTELATISEIRMLLEPHAAAKAAERRGGSARSQIERALESIRLIETTSSRRELITQDLEIHRTIYRAAENPHLEETLVRLDNLATRIWCLVLHRLPSITTHITEHEALLAAILGGDSPGAERLARTHVAAFEATVRTAL